MKRLRFAVVLAALSGLLALDAARAQEDRDRTESAAVRAAAEQLVEKFNAAKAADVAALFLPNGELIDEVGVVHQGQKEIQELLTAFFSQFPGAKLALNIESVRLVGPIAIDEGTRTMSSADGEERSRFRYIAVWSKSDKGWQLASFRDFSDDPVPTAHDYLEPLAWMVGDWVNEGADGKVTISYRWSDDENYLLGEFQTSTADGTKRKSTQRIGWDPSVGRIRSWLFDADGGFAEGTWTPVNDGVVIKSSAVNPDGTVATATLDITIQDKDHFTLAGTDRVVGDSLDEDFEITVTREPPAAGK